MKHLERTDFGGELILLLDYDGTLTPIKRKPELAILSDELRRILKKLSHAYDMAIVSGRSVVELMSLVDIPGIWYAGNHGFEIVRGEKRWTEPRAAAFKLKMNGVAAKLSGLKSIPGVIIEDKGLTLSVHYRCVQTKEVDKVKAAFGEAIEGEEIRITEGKKVLEVRPPFDWDKGKAVEWILKEMGWDHERVVYLGDDRTDEDAFCTVNKLHGISVIVSDKPSNTCASHFLKGPKEVERILVSLLQ